MNRVVVTPTQVTKTYAHWENFLRDAFWMTRLYDVDANPSTLTLTMPHLGERLTEWHPAAAQRLLQRLSDAGVQHNDITHGNLLWDGSELNLIDFEWATPWGVQPPESWPRGLGSSFRAGPGWVFDDEASLRKVQQWLGS